MNIAVVNVIIFNEDKFVTVFTFKAGTRIGPLSVDTAPMPTKAAYGALIFVLFTIIPFETLDACAREAIDKVMASATILTRIFPTIVRIDVAVVSLPP